MSPKRPLAKLALAAAVLLALPAAPAAAATIESTSSNWAGYAVARKGTRFRRVSGTWVQPAVTCTGDRAYSAYWVGLGGYRTTSQALEQIGTAADCDSTGTAHYTAWYELVPAAAVTVKLNVRAGDTIAASVAVSAHRVRLHLVDRTTGAAVTRTLRAVTVDTTSAEWMAEAPSLCDERGFCATQPLADFGTASFTAARATTTGGHAGAIRDPAWSAVAISLEDLPDGDPRFAGDMTSAGGATPGALSSTGDAFSISFAGSSPAPGQVA
ncbi:MAG: hypothetical protein E6G10_23800 [Actinobacteria bacterium]|nr:MAG: hypothetical protein E6G10_23800 [Actinomycetota bacterium]